MNEPMRIMIVDDHALVREGLAALLALYADEVEVVGEASDGLEAVRRVSEIRPDIILMDIAMPNLGGLEATVEIKKQMPEVKVLVLTQYEDHAYLKRFLEVGASGYILKKAMGAELLTAIRAVGRSGTYLDPSMLGTVVEGFLNHERSRAAGPYELLTDREKQVLKLIAEGLTHKQIAQALGISTKTVIAHQSHISEKIGLHNKADFIKFAIQEGIIQVPSLPRESDC